MTVLQRLVAFVALSGLSAGFAQDATGRPDRTLPWVTQAAQAPRVEFRTFDSRTMGAKVSYHVYTPAA